MEFGAVADFFSHQPADDFGTDYKCNHQAGQYCGNGTKHHVLVGVEAEPMCEDLAQAP